MNSLHRLENRRQIGEQLTLAVDEVLSVVGERLTLLGKQLRLVEVLTVVDVQLTLVGRQLAVVA